MIGEVERLIARVERRCERLEFELAEWKERAFMWEDVAMDEDGRLYVTKLRAAEERIQLLSDQLAKLRADAAA